MVMGEILFSNLITYAVVNHSSGYPFFLAHFLQRYVCQLLTSIIKVKAARNSFHTITHIVNVPNGPVSASNIPIVTTAYASKPTTNIKTTRHPTHDLSELSSRGVNIVPPQFLQRLDSLPSVVLAITNSVWALHLGHQGFLGSGFSDLSIIC